MNVRSQRCATMQPTKQSSTRQRSFFFVVPA